MDTRAWGARSKRIRVWSRSLVGATLLLLSACDPGAVPHDVRNADLGINVEPNGVATAGLRLAPELEDQLRPTAERIAESVFQSGETSVVIDGNDGGFDFAVITAADAYQPGSTPRVSIHIDDETAAALSALGAETLDVNFCAPYVPFEIESSSSPNSDEARCGYWRLDLASQTLDATMAMRPDPQRWYRSVALTLIALVSAVAALVSLRRLRPLDTRRRRLVVAFAVPGAAAFAVGVTTLAAAPNGDNLGVAGKLDGAALTVATWGPVALLPLGVARVVLGVVTLTTQRARPAIHGYPPPPPTPPG